MKKKITTSLILLLFALACLPIVTYAWFTFTFVSSSNEFSTGKLAPKTELYYWNKQSELENKWTEAPKGTGGSYLLYPSLGEITNLSELPSGFDIYLKIRVDDHSGAAYKWDASIANIDIKALDANGNQILAAENNLVGLMDYYGGDSPETSQKCFYYATSALGTDNLDPTAINTYGQTANLATRGQSLSDNFLASNSYLYVHITVGISELQNIIRYIPIDQAPYVVQFTMTIVGEGRTME